MSATNKTTYYELSQYIGSDKPTYLSDYNGDMLKIDNGIHDAASDAASAVSTANTAASAASTASENASTAVTTANAASTEASNAASVAATASSNAGAALTAAQAAQTAAAANTITNLAPAYDPTLTYAVGDLVTYIDDQGSGKLYKCIIAVESPEAFNINKWDDVTVSDVIDALDDKYVGKAIMVASAGPAEGRTWGSAFGALVASVDTTTPSNVEYFLVRRTSSSKTFYREVMRATDRITFASFLPQTYPTGANTYQYRFEGFVFENFYNTSTSQNVNMVRDTGLRTTQTGEFSPESFVNSIYTDTSFGDATLELWMIVH